MTKRVLTYSAIAGEVATPVSYFGWASVSFVVALAGPFGTFENHSFLWRLAYWGGLIGVAYVLAVCIRILCRRYIPNEPAWLEDVTVAALLAAVFGPFVYGLNLWLIGREDFTSFGWFELSVLTFLIALATITLRQMIHEQNVQSSAPQRDRLLDRIEAPNGARIARISSDNHHVLLCMDDGSSHRILMRLRDAVAEVDVEQGFCVHRSHWVALAQIEGVTFVNNREMVQLIGLDPVPVGPKYRHNLVDAGFLSA